MKLTIEQTLRGVAHNLQEQVSPALTDSFAIGATRMARDLINIIANTYDDAAAIRVEENAKLRALFAGAAGEVSDRKLGADLAEAGRSRDPGLRISELDAETGRLRSLLVALHAHIEGQAGEAARAIDARIWAFLEETETARAPRA
ncbi:hypothetical protein DMC47_45180 [Nostoc sp. 3335mG]|nr:hypothetical protein DMC47_45180 [Nostoc sp. 3335mG]